jgi:glyoxylase-like metal-dependent hydrolase (beta-lactamase superfamily II)
MHEFLPGVFVWSRLSERHGYDFNGALVTSDEGALCVDPVEPTPADLDRLALERVSWIVLTNRNHARAANLIRERTGAPVLIHSADADHAIAQGTPIDDVIEVGRRFGPCVTVGVPGKSPGEVALHDQSRRLLIVGDAVIGNPAGRCSLLPERVIDDPVRLRESVARLLELDFDALLVGDGVSIRRGAQERLADLVASFAT